MSDDLVNLTVTAAADAIRRGDITSESLVDACLARIAARDGEVRAWAHIDPDYARAAARAADTERRAGRGTGPLHGVPIGIKDIIDTADQPTEYGCPIFKGKRPMTDAAVVTRLRNAGAVILGKTVTTELALLTPAATRNPRALDHSPGGSSAGSAAAVADGMVPAALGTQTAGSVLRPASYCGIYGFKPTYGLIPRTGILMQSHTLDTAGVLARSLDDVALLTDTIAAQDPADAASYARSQPSLVAELNTPVPIPPLFAFIKSPAWNNDAAAVMKDAFAELVAVLGAQVEEIELASLTDALEAQRIVQLAENAAYYGPLQSRAPKLISKGLTERLDIGRDLKATQLVDALRMREPVYEALEDVLMNYTAIITPAAPGPAPKLSEGITGSPIFNGLWTFLGCPCVSLPLIEADGLPIGVQLVAARRDDGRLLRTSKWLVQHLSGEA